MGGRRRGRHQGPEEGDPAATRRNAERVPETVAGDIKAPAPATRSIMHRVGLTRAEDGVELARLEDEPLLPEFRFGSDKYDVLELLGEGGMGRVYLARDADLRRTVALKMTRDADPELVRRFVAEAQVMGQLHHPGILAVHELGLTESGEPFYAMPLVRGRSLQGLFACLREGEPGTVARWSLTRLVQAFLQSCQAVSYAHEKGVLHLDLKPDNVMIGRHGEVQVLDWGLARVVREGEVDTLLGVRSPSESVVEGSPAFMAPEQVAADQVDHRTDIWALGVILYELLTLDLPFEGATVDDLLVAITTRVPRPLRQVAGGRDIPRVLEVACLKALSLRPADRQQSVEELSEEVQVWLESETDRTRRRALAESKAQDGHACMREYLRLKSEVERLHGASISSEASAEPWLPVSEKHAQFAVEDVLTSRRQELIRAASRTITTLNEALGHDAEHAGAREALADYYWDRLSEAEKRGDREEVSFYSELTEAYHDGKYSLELSGDGSLSLRSEPPGAEVIIAEFQECDLVLEARDERALGTTPLHAIALPMGSYLVTLRLAGHRETKYPVFISRNREWDGSVRLLEAGLLDDSFVHVPAGPFIQGGDAECRGIALPRTEPWVEGFCIAVHPVTNGEYLEFLNAIAETEGEEAALLRSPRRVADKAETSYLNAGPDGRLCIPEIDNEGDEWSLDEPATGLSWFDATEYCRWMSERMGTEVRLPTESEWEAATRGRDGRWFPWGNRFDPSLCNMQTARRPKEGIFVEVGQMEQRFPADVSVYGMRGGAGNVRDWTTTLVEPGRPTRIVKGGACASPATHSRCAYRARNRANSVLDYVGFRLVVALPPPP